MSKWTINVFFAVLLAGCGGGNNDNGTANNANNANNQNNVSNTTQNNVSNTTQNSESNTTQNNTTQNNTTQNNTTATNNTPGNNQTGLILPCENLTFNDSCSDPMAASGYPACSDFFGDSSSEPTCEAANPNAEFSESPCAAYEFYVGSCVFYNDALPNNCYITHVGATSADAVQAGRDFWSNPAVCPNWMDGN